ncbi:MAG: hypothetical protein ACPH2J_10880, partial [Akkermansiaceae bacterium]
DRKHGLGLLFSRPFLQLVDGIRGGPGRDSDGNDVPARHRDGECRVVHVHQRQGAPETLLSVLQLD